MKGLVRLVVLLGLLCLVRARQSRSSSADVPSTCDLLSCRDCMTNVCSWASTIHARTTESPDVCQYCDNIHKCQAKGQTGNAVRNSSTVWRRSSEKEPDSCVSFGYPSSCPSSGKSYSTTLKRGSTGIFYNFLHLHFIRAALQNFVKCDNLDVSDSNGQAHQVDYVSLKFSEEDLNPPCTTTTKCNSKSQVVVVDQMDGKVFCFAANSKVAPTFEWKNSVLELTYKDAMPCCKSNSPTGTPNGNISVVLRIDIALPSNEKFPELTIRNYDSLLSCSSQSNPVIVDAARYPAEVQRIRYIDLNDSDFYCTSSDSREEHDDQAPVASTVECKLLKIFCMNDSASENAMSCINTAAQQYLSVQVTSSGPTNAAAECVEWAASQSGKPLSLNPDRNGFVWNTTAITKELYEKRCRFRFQAVARRPGSRIHQTTSKAVEIPVVFNCSAWEPKCDGQPRGYCNPRTLNCECKETCYKLAVHYRGDNCETDPWCSSDIPWIGTGIGGVALVFTVTSTAIGCWIRRRRRRQREQPEREGYRAIPNGDGGE